MNGAEDGSRPRWELSNRYGPAPWGPRPHCEICGTRCFCRRKALC